MKISNFFKSNLTIVTLTFVFGCSKKLDPQHNNGITETLNTKFSIKYIDTDEKGNLNLSKNGNYFQFKMIEKTELSKDEKFKFAELKSQFESAKKEGKLNVDSWKITGTQIAPSNGFLKVGDKYFINIEVLQKFIEAKLKTEGFNEVCVEYKRGMLTSYCQKFDKVQKQNFAEIKENIEKQYTITKEYKKGDLITESEYRLDILEIKYDNVSKFEYHITLL